MTSLSAPTTRTTPFRSDSLQERFPEEYRQLFIRCQEVASAPNVFFWTGELSGFYGGLTLTQKLPLRTYIGLEIVPDAPSQIAVEYRTYQPDENCFVNGSLDTSIAENLKQSLLGWQADKPNPSGITLHILTEIPLGHSLGSLGSIAAALAILICKQSDLASRFAIARRILAQLQEGNSSGTSAYTALAPTPAPIVFRSNPDNTHSATPLEDLVVGEGPLSWPIDFGLIYTGVQSHGESVIRANHQTMQELEQATQTLNHLLSENNDLNFQTSYLSALNMVTGLTITSLLQLFREGSRPHLLEKLFNSLNQYQNLLYTLGAFHGPIDTLYARIHSLASKQINGVGSGVKVAGLGRGGAVLFVMPYGNHRSAILKLISELRRETGYELWLDYASWIDGIGGEPARLEQDLDENIHSRFVARDRYFLTILNQGNLHTRVVPSEQLEEILGTYEIVLDQINGKVILSGSFQKSTQLPSQKATIKILAQLLKSPGFTLTNRELPGSYGSSRYDLHGKIVLPLTKQVKEHTGHTLQLQVQGDAYENFTLSLLPGAVRIALLSS